ncbi:ribosome-inactivating family protein [Streptomyces cyaneofuscatus]|uniref:ribosome-inactivating family protein n=1 Tax=Streptomyces cyaneofuscatus TaxID=66883 RepID=UPI00364C6BD0
MCWFLALVIALVSTITVLSKPAAAQDEEDDVAANYLRVVQTISEAARGAERLGQGGNRRGHRTTSASAPARALPYDLARPNPITRNGFALVSLDSLRRSTNMPSVSLVIRLDSMYVMGFYQITLGTHRFFRFNEDNLGEVPQGFFGPVDSQVQRVTLPYVSRYGERGMGGPEVWDQHISGEDLHNAVERLGYTDTERSSMVTAGPHLARLVMTLMEGARFNNVRDSVHTALAAGEGWPAAEYRPYINDWADMSQVIRTGFYHTLEIGQRALTLYLSVLRANINILHIPKGSPPSRMCSGSGAATCVSALTSKDRLGSSAGLPDWSQVGYRGGSALPDHQQYTADAACRITPEKLSETYGVKPDDGQDDSDGLQRAIDDTRSRCSSGANFDQLSLITLPAGRLDITRQISVDADYLVIRGQGSDPANGRTTRIVFRPDADTRYDTLAKDGGRWDPDSMVYEAGADTAKGGWIWPGRGLFRVQTREVAPRYADEWAAAPANRKDLYEGSVNQHWASGAKLRGSADEPAYSAKEGGRLIHLDAKANMSRFQKGGHLWVGAANSRKFYEQQGAMDETRINNLHMRQQVFRISAVDAESRTLSIDKPLEFDLPVDSTSDGSAPIDGTAYGSKVTPLKMVVGVGFENFSFTQEMPKLSSEQAKHNYGNLAPETAMHGLVFKWAADSWARGVRAEMTGSHPIVTEVARNLQFEGNHLDGAWNKGKGGNGYFRGSRVWDSLYAYNTTRNLRHFTLQWSASGNVVYANDFDSDLNLHGGWERRNLFENNTVRVPYEHYSGNCTARCGGEGGEVEAGTWYPIWWAAGAKAVKWAGSSGPQNVFHNNVLAKQLVPGGPYVDYLPYGRSGDGAQPVYQFGSAADDPSRFQHLTQSGAPLSDWNGHETDDYSQDNAGVNTSHTAPGTSVFLKNTA